MSLITPSISVQSSEKTQDQCHADIFSRDMIQALLQCGYSKSALAIEIGIAVSTINRILRGNSNPGNQTFTKLLRLYCAVCYKDMTE